MKFRRYLGSDCNSWDGFNNGQYVDDESIEVEGYSEAERLCMEALSRYLGIEVTEDNSEDIGHGDGPCIEFITGYFDDKGNEITEEKYYELMEVDENSVGYTYVYVSADPG